MKSHDSLIKVDIEDIEKIDKIIGNRLLDLRVKRGISRNKLSEYIFVSHQQTQKYEKAVNRVSASRLYLISKVLGCPIEYFFLDFAKEENNELIFNNNHDIQLIVKKLLLIKDKNHREAVINLIDSLSDL